MKKAFSMLLSLLFISCLNTIIRENGIEVIIVNETDNTLTNINFHTSEKIALNLLNDIKPGDSSQSFYMMKEHKVDGNYVLNFSRNDSVSETIPCGYYSNGFSSDRWVKFRVRNDTVFTEFSKF
ncbi:hypothetical protein G5B37_03775 [Rasiella rasia]|uniref:Lipoprotein n=1 Tax=Rasiella rasia TaxID=2744027 RepID=A0A6G6GJN7_9FLAO|nr:hypothetical protein [Rasiella rasia]QIE58710.1 hypothetical protein G5B37_03775 [Rasiella rasia]